ncbi:hypothetical protein J4444_00815 [Candidatus Woesearchaeota archaeon]|nr:hypothetical protein [Candidatus Woesearchaeota archaeon]
MNNKQHFLVGVMFLILFSFSFIIYSAVVYSSEHCSNQKSIDASITIRSSLRPVIGLNADTINLTFGTTSPYSTVKRSVMIHHSNNVAVQVWMTGSLASWVEITPNNFNLSSIENKEVDFIVNVPANASDGIYNGKAIFCFRE